MKRVLKVLMNELLYGAHLVSLGAVSIILSIILVVRSVGAEFKVLIISYLIMQIIYSYNHYRELITDIDSNPERVKHIGKRKNWIKFAPFIYATVLFGVVLTTNLETFMFSLFMLIGGILYTEYFKRLPILGFKNYYVSFFWAILVLLIPLYYQLDNIGTYFYFVVFIFIRGIVNTSFFDIKDIESDRKSGVKTFPARFGKKNTLYLLHVINVMSIIPILIGVLYGDLPAISFVLLLTIINGIFYLTKAMFMDDKSLRILSYILIDGEYILWPLIVLAGYLIF